MSLKTQADKLSLKNSIPTLTILIFFTACVTTLRPEHPGSSQRNRYSGPISNGEWSAPTDANVNLSQAFRPRKNPKHRGIDLAGDRNQPIYAVKAGRISYAGQKFNGYGKMVLIEHDLTWSTLYSHLNSIKVSNGQYVKQGQVIGYMGRTGRASGVHLHFEIYRNKIPQDPLRIVPVKYVRKEF